MEKLLIIDGNSILNRAFYGIRPLTTKEGIPTNAIFGFLNILLKVIEESKPEYITVAFDVSKKTFRNDLYDLYKANRKGMPDDLATQLPIIKDVLDSLNISHIGIEGYEADDIIGTVSNICETKNINCEILTGDKDDLQLCSDNTTVLLVTTQGGKTSTVSYNTSGVLYKYGVSPKEFIDLKGLMGDSSDNIPGVKGVGEKTAISLIKEFKSIENLYENLDSPLIKKSVKEKLLENKDMAFLSKKLATIDRFVPISIDFNEFKVSSPKEDAVLLFEKLELNTFIKRLGFDTKKEEVNDFKIEYETDTSFIKNATHLFYLINESEIIINSNSKILKLSFEKDFELLKQIFEDKNVSKITYNAKEHIIYLNSIKINYSGKIFDIKLANYLLDPASEGRLSAIIYSVINKSCEKDEEFVYHFPEVFNKLSDSLDENNLSKLYYDIELPVMKILASMQIRGIKIDVPALNDLSKKFEEKISDLTYDIYKISGEEFNINSTKQLSVILFEKIGLKPSKKTKTGYSTDNSVLENLKGEHPVIDLILEYRTIAKLKSTYVDSLLSLCDENGNLHSNFHQTVTQTGRLSSSDPNLQNIPQRIELGRQIRKLFTPVGDGNVFVSADYSQIELRVLAQICGDENLINAFNNNEDIHAQAASKIYSVDIKDVTKEMRANAKMVNFGLLYGKSEFTLAKDLQVSRKEAKDIIDTYFTKYPDIRKYMYDIVEFAKENGYVKTLLGRIRYIKELSDRNYMKRLSGERIALNTPIQGTAADIMKIAMIKTQKELQKLNLNAKIVLQIHDELVIETTKEDLQKVKEVLINSMENAVKINVPLTVSCMSGDNLYELK